MRSAANVVIFLILLTAHSFAQCRTENCGLVVRGSVTELKMTNGKDSVVFDVRLAMEFKNASDAPIILFRPNTDNSYFEGGYYLGGYSLTQTAGGEYIHGDGAWESIMGSDFYKTLADKLDTKTPTEEFTKVLQPNETWALPDKARITFRNFDDKYSPGLRRSWNAMQSLPSKLWLQVSYELSPWNVEFFKPNLLRRLAKRWKPYGKVLIEQKKDGRFNHFGVRSEPMAIDFSQAEGRDPDVISSSGGFSRR